MVPLTLLSTVILLCIEIGQGINCTKVANPNLNSARCEIGQGINTKVAQTVAQVFDSYSNAAPTITTTLLLICTITV